LKGDEVLIVSNREPYIHVRRKDNVVEIQRPASGLVTALEPIVRATSGTWIAHGAGSADRETVDKHDHVVQDYHFALLPRVVHERLPRATIIAFWHIPWPNPEAFGILPWREEVLEGLLGSSILGFHAQFHCNNFFDTADRFMEARVDRETFTISYGGDPTEVRRYPISIEWPPSALALRAPVEECRRQVRAQLGAGPQVKLGVGVDRLDYTKGILEPRWAGEFTFLQVAAPSRSAIDEYQNLDAKVRALAARINERFGRQGYQPIALRIEHHDAAQVYQLYRAADLCCVSSLHDGMNLVAEEFVAARELSESLIVNPYDTEQSAAAMHLALTMSPDEQRTRAARLRAGAG